MRIGVLGTMVWDRIDHPDVAPVERWGGIAYSLAAASAVLPDGWTLRPIVRIGRDLADRARRFFDGLPGLERARGLRIVEEANNRVHLVYTDAQHREERLSGGVGGWSWAELEPALDGLDALYVNMIAGFELELDVAGRLRDAVSGPIYADLHSLLLAVGPGGRRVPRPLARRDDWLDAFDLVQVNERELGLVAGSDDPRDVAREAIRRGLGALFLTHGRSGATWFAAGDRARPWQEPARGDVRAVRVPAGARTGDPTGCGDVWGATCFLSLLRDHRINEAVAEANRAAARNVDHRGADALREHLRSEA